MKKTIPYIIGGLILLYLALASYVQVTEFTDSTTAFNITSNTTKDITIAKNASIISANISLIGYDNGNFNAFANASSIQCTGNWIAGYPCANTFDNNYTTYGTMTAGGGYPRNAFVYFNYSFDTEFRRDILDAQDGDSHVNLSMASCKTNPLEIRATSFDIGTTWGSSWECKITSSTWSILKNTTCGLTETCYKIHEETLFYRNYPEDVFIKVNDTLVFNHTGNLTRTNASISLNISLIQHYLIYNQTIPIIFSALSWGNLRVVNLSIKYGGTIKYNIIDENSLNLVANTNIQFISDDYSVNTTTSTGSGNVTNMSEGEYNIKYSASGYNTRYYYLNHSVRSDAVSTVNLYLLDSSGTNITMYVYDHINEKVEGAVIYIYRYNITTNSFYIVGARETDFEGKAIFDIELNSNYYKFYVYYNGQLKLQTLKSIITGTSLTFTISTENLVLEEYYQVNDVSGYVVFDDTNLQFVFYYLDSSSTAVTQGCLYVYSITPKTESLFNSNCVSSSGSTILISPTNKTGLRYVAYGYVTIGGTNQLLDTESYEFESVSAEDFGSLGLLLVSFLTIAAATLALYSLQFSFMIIGMPTLIGSYLKWIDLPVEYALGLVVVCILLGFIIRRKT